MTADVLSRVLPLSERHVRGQLDDRRAASLRSLVMRVDVVDVDADVLIDFLRPGPSKLGAFAADNDGAVADDELRVRDGSAEAVPPAAVP